MDDGLARTGDLTRVVTVVVATYNRADSLLGLLGDLAAQVLPAGWRQEIVVVDDGSTPATADLVAGDRRAEVATIIFQHNAGPAAARHRAIGASSGEVIVSIDDDMRVDEGFVASHVAHHLDGADVVLGRIDEPADGRIRPLFDRLHQKYLNTRAQGQTSGAVVAGTGLFTGNVSFRRDRYDEIGGFDVSLRRCEDRDLGVRFGLAGCRIVAAPEASARHLSPHEDVGAWRRRTMEWGALDERIAAKASPCASPWSVLHSLPTAFRPVALAAAVAPGPTARWASLLYRIGGVVARMGGEGVALRLAGLTYGIDYFRGVGTASTSWSSVAGALRPPPVEAGVAEAVPPRGPARFFFAAVAADHACSRHHQERYNARHRSVWRLPVDALTSVGFQMLIAVRLMQALRAARVPVAPKAVSRLIRHLYGAEIHCDAAIAPGISIVHGNGLVIAGGAVVGPRCILFQGVTLGKSLDPTGTRVGAPTLEEGVHVGPGAVLLGPIVVGRRAKVMANVVVTIDVPAETVAKPPPVELVVPRRLRVLKDNPGQNGAAQNDTAQNDTAQNDALRNNTERLAR